MATRSKPIKAVLFDFMGTCLDWHSSVTQAMPATLASSEASQFALKWRQEYFLENDRRVRQNLAPEDIDDTLHRTLQTMLEETPDWKPLLGPAQKEALIAAWHYQTAWLDVPAAIQKLRDDLDLEVFVFANGTTRLQLDLVRSSGLGFHMLFSSQLLGDYKPKPSAYEKMLQLVKLSPEEVVMVAAHAYDLRGAQKAGMNTIYIHRWTDDVNENMDQVRSEFGDFLEGMADLPKTIQRLQHGG